MAAFFISKNSVNHVYFYTTPFIPINLQIKKSLLSRIGLFYNS